ncbi:MAG TPA: hypothetical protein VH478_20060 [Trebonia sp.]|nr:hypothetical protein [Trebonia sp.]
MAAFLAACHSSGGQPSVAGTTPAATASPGSATSAAGATATSAVPAASARPSASATPGGPVNLVLTDAIRGQLVAAAARLNSLPASAYTGLVQGESYYGLDPATNTYWAGGALNPSPSSEQAQVSVQDDGGYYIFQEAAGGSWTASAEGLAGTEGATCSVHVPPALVALWHWPAGACHPAGA